MLESREVKKHFIQLSIHHNYDKHLHSLIYMVIYWQIKKLELDQSKYQASINFLFLSAYAKIPGVLTTP